MSRNNSRWKSFVSNILHGLVLTVSLAIIVLISIDAFDSGVRLPDSDIYGRMQLPFCIIFLLDFFFDFYRSDNRGRFFRHNFLILFVSIPYSLILAWSGIGFHGFIGLAIHYLPTLRAVIAMAYIVSFVSRNRLIGLFASYVIILILAIYFSSLIFYLAERHVNTSVTNYWQALYWSLMQATTLGASFYATTTVGKAVAMIISAMGMLMFPLFTVYLTQIVKKYTTPDSSKTTEKS